MNTNLKLAVLALCGGAAHGAQTAEANHLELIICDVGALQAAVSDQTRPPVALPHQQPNRLVRASRTFMDWRDNRIIAEELADRYQGTVQEGMDPFYYVAAFPLPMAERILPEYFLKPMDRTVAAAVAA